MMRPYKQKGARDEGVPFVASADSYDGYCKYSNFSYKPVISDKIEGDWSG